MDLVERYLHAVGFWLPRAQRDDIVAELSEDIRSQVEDQETDRGRPLAEDEVSALLQQRGHPVVVAGQYLPQECLIGPTLFPLYRFVLKIVALCYLVPWALVWLGFLAFDPAFRSAHGGSAWFRTLGAFWADFWLVALVAAAVVTIVFAALERSQGKSVLLTWDPRKLAPARDPDQIPRSSSVFELVAGLVFLAWWMAAMSSPVVLDRPGVRIVLAPAWTRFYWGYFALAAAGLALSGANLLHPRWTKRRAAARAACDLAGSALFCLLCSSNILAEIRLDGVPASRSLEIARAINAWATKAVPIVAAVGVVIVAFDVYRIVRTRDRRAEPRAAV